MVVGVDAWSRWFGVDAWIRMGRVEYPWDPILENQILEQNRPDCELQNRMSRAYWTQHLIGHQWKGALIFSLLKVPNSETVLITYFLPLYKLESWLQPDSSRSRLLTKESLARPHRFLSWRSRIRLHNWSLKSVPVYCSCFSHSVPTGTSHGIHALVPHLVPSHLSRYHRPEWVFSRSIQHNESSILNSLRSPEKFWGLFTGVQMNCCRLNGRLLEPLGVCHIW